MPGSVALTAWGLEDAMNSQLRVCRGFLPNRSPCCDGGLACATTKLGRWPNLRHANHPWPCLHSLRSILRSLSMSTPAVGAIFADSAGTTACRLTPSRNGRRQHPPRSTARLRLTDSERHISNPKPYVDTPGCRNATRRRRQIRNRAHADQLPAQNMVGILGWMQQHNPPKGKTDGKTVMHSWEHPTAHAPVVTLKGRRTHARLQAHMPAPRYKSRRQCTTSGRNCSKREGEPTHAKEKVPTHTQMCPHASTETRKRDTMQKADNILHSPEPQLSELDVKCSSCPLFHLASNASASGGGRKAWERGSRQKRMDESPGLLRYNPTLCGPPARARLAGRLTCLPGGGGSL